MVLVLPLLVGLGSAQILSSLRSGERESRDGRVELSRMHENVLFIEHVTGHVMQMGLLTPDLEEKLDTFRPEAERSLEALRASVGSGATTRRVADAWKAYSAHVDNRLASVERGPTPHVMRMTPAKKTPNPTYDALVATIESEMARLSARASSTSRRTDLAAVAIVAIAALVLSLVFQRRERRRRVEALEEMERTLLAESEARFRSLVQNASDVITVVDAAGTIVYESDAIERVMGFEPSTRVGSSIFGYVLPEDAATLRDALAAVGDGRDAGKVEFRARDADGEIHWVEAGLKDLSHEAGVGGIVINHRDVTERTVLEDQLRQSQKMEAVGQLAGGVAHDFNNILMGISGYAELASLHVRDDPDRAARDIAEIQNAAERASALTRQLLAFGRRQMLRPTVLQLNASVSAVESLLRRLIGTDIETTLDLDPSLPPVKADTGQLEQVVVNLAVNARDAMPDGGRLVLRTRVVEVDTAQAQALDLAPGQYVALEVLDTGVGMDELVRSRAVEPFYTTKDPGKGTGLGLSMAYGMVRQSGGAIALESEPGKGTVVRVLLPPFAAATEDSGFDAPSANGRPVSLAERPKTARRVLVVEDEDVVADLVADLLSGHGFSVELARRAHEALAIAKEGGHFDLLITDLVMPGMNGRELAQALQQEQPDLPVLFMSGYAGTAVIERGLLDVGTPFIQKPFKLADLLHAVDAACKPARAA